MPITLNPAVPALGIFAPVLGPWFSVNAVQIPALAAGSRLEVPINAAGADWYAPAAGVFSLLVVQNNVIPPMLDTLQDSNGDFPFAQNRLIGYFRLLPEVEARIDELMGMLPPPTAAAATAQQVLPTPPTRPRVRSFAMEIPFAQPLTLAQVMGYFAPGEVQGNTPVERMNFLGLAPDAQGNPTNATLPMTSLRRPGGALVDRDRLLRNLPAQVNLWAFDRRGRAIDPGAVACWWSWLLNTGVGDDPATGAVDFQLLAPNIAANAYPQSPTNQPLVCQVAPQLTTHLVDPHEGLLGAPFIGGRLQDNANPVAANLITGNGNGPVLTFTAAPPAPPPPAAPNVLSLDNPPVDTAPRPRMALLPAGTYGNALTLWPGGALNGVPRDFARVAVVDEEAHLTGLSRRDSHTAPANPADRRNSAQNRPSTRILVARTANANGVLLANAQATADALLALPAQGATRWVLGVTDTAWGGTPAAIAAPVAGGTLPVALANAGNAPLGPSQYKVQALQGGGASSDDFQTVLVEFNFSANGLPPAPPLTNTWVRAWPTGFDANEGEHLRLTGGAARIDANGLAWLVMVLPKSWVAPQGLLGMDVQVTQIDAAGNVILRRRYQDLRFTRPGGIGGAAALAVAGNWVICETGVSGNGAALPAGSVPPGGHVVLLTGTPTLVDRTVLQAADWDANTLRNRIGAGADIVCLTEPAFEATPNRADITGRPMSRMPTANGDLTGGLGALLGGRLYQQPRASFTDMFNGLGAIATEGAEVLAASAPFSLLDRHEVAAYALPGGGASAVIGSAPPVPWALSPALQFHQTFPGVTAGLETHGTGVTLTGLPAVAVAEYVRERTAGMGFGQVQGLNPTEKLFVVQSELAVVAEASTALPAPAEGAAAGPVVAVLRTAARGLDGWTGVSPQLANTPSLYPFSQGELRLETWLNTQLPWGGGAGNLLRANAAGPIDSMTRALDRRVYTSAYGAREALYALQAAINRAQDFIYLETPGVDNLQIAADGENINLWQELITQMMARVGLRVLLCVPARLPYGTPRKFRDVRDHGLHDALQQVVNNGLASRFASFSPGVGADRALRIASTTVIVDEAFCLTGTTHLTRRGLSWDSSLAAAVFDERLTDGRPTDIVQLRNQLLADRLGMPLANVPADPTDLVRAVTRLTANGASPKLASTPIVRPKQTPTAEAINIWNPDGSVDGLTLTGVATAFAQAVALTGVDQMVVDG